MQGRLLEWAKNKPAFSEKSPSVGLLQFVRSTPGVLAPLVGQKSDAHVTENLEILRMSPLNENDFHLTVKNLTG